MTFRTIEAPTAGPVTFVRAAAQEPSARQRLIASHSFRAEQWLPSGEEPSANHADTAETAASPNSSRPDTPTQSRAAALAWNRLYLPFALLATLSILLAPAHLEPLPVALLLTWSGGVVAGLVFVLWRRRAGGGRRIVLTLVLVAHLAVMVVVYAFLEEHRYLLPLGAILLEVVVLIGFMRITKVPAAPSLSPLVAPTLPGGPTVGEISAEQIAHPPAEKEPPSAF